MNNAGKRVIPALSEIRKKIKETIQLDNNLHHGGTLVALVLRNHGVKYDDHFLIIF